MDASEKLKELKRFCKAQGSCSTCPLAKLKPKCGCSYDGIFEVFSISDENMDEAYEFAKPYFKNKGRETKPTIEKKRKRIRSYCETQPSDECDNCILNPVCDSTHRFIYEFTEEECDAAIKILERHQVPQFESHAELEAIAFPKQEPTIKDSGERREFESGAVRDIQEGKGRCDLMPLDAVNIILNDDVMHAISVFQERGDVCYLGAALLHFRDKRYVTNANMLLETSKHFEEGAKKYGEYNWQKGIPTHCYIDSAVRHYLKYLRGDNDEPHDRAFCWNILCCIWTCIHKPELNDYAKKEENT